MAAPFPLGQRLVKVADWPEGAAVSVTDTPEAGPFSAETCTAYAAAWPALTLVAEACTLTHSSPWNEAGAVAEGEGEGVAAGSGSHCELAAASAAGAVISGTALSRASTPPQIRQAAAIRVFAGHISMRLPRRSKKSSDSGICESVPPAGQSLFPAFFQNTIVTPS